MRSVHHIEQGHGTQDDIDLTKVKVLPDRFQSDHQPRHKKGGRVEPTFRDIGSSHSQTHPNDECQGGDGHRRPDKGGPMKRKEC